MRKNRIKSNEIYNRKKDYKIKEYSKNYFKGPTRSFAFNIPVTHSTTTLEEWNEFKKLVKKQYGTQWKIFARKLIEKVLEEGGVNFLD